MNIEQVHFCTSFSAMFLSAITFWASCIPPSGLPTIPAVYLLWTVFSVQTCLLLPPGGAYRPILTFSRQPCGIDLVGQTSTWTIRAGRYTCLLLFLVPDCSFLLFTVHLEVFLDGGTFIYIYLLPFFLPVGIAVHLLPGTDLNSTSFLFLSFVFWSSFLLIGQGVAVRAAARALLGIVHSRSRALGRTPASTWALLLLLLPVQGRTWACSSSLLCWAYTAAAALLYMVQRREFLNERT